MHKVNLQFECKFYPTIADKLASQDGILDDAAHLYKDWSPFSECKAKHQPEKLR